MTPLSESANAKAVRELGSVTCPGCNCMKKRGQSLCKECYRSLPQATRNALYRTFGDGYLDAYDSALEYLKANKE
jgi:hypothetical protein